MAFYSHELEDRQIRLVIVEPGELGDPVKCQVKVVSLDDDDKLSYEALSYHWGAHGSPHHHVLVERQKFPVQENLHSALHDLRLHHQPRPIYIDAISINQDNEAPEKGRQKALMGEVYERAPKVVIYVGESGEDSDFALDTVLEIDDEFQQQLRDGTRDSSQAWPTLDLGATRFCRQQMLPCFDARPWIAINRLLRRSWWKRVWTVPEVILPKHDMVFVCGPKTVPWVALCRVTLALARFDFREHWPSLYAADYNLFHALQPTIHGIREMNRAGTRDSSLLSNLVAFYYRSAGKYSHDQVYAFTSFSSDVSPDDFPIDHRRQLPKLFTDVAAFFVRQKNPKFFALCQSNERLAELPSWVPD